MQKFHFVIPETLSKLRIDKALAELCHGASRSQIQKAIKNNKLALNGSIISNLSCLVKENDQIDFTLEEQKPRQVEPMNIKLDIVYEDDDLIVINKAVGMTSHPGAGSKNDTLVNALLFHTDSLSDIGGEIRRGIVHRLDKETSGLMVVAKNNETHIALAEQITTRELVRRYKALVWGMMRPPSGVIDVAIGRSTLDRKKMATFKNGGKRAITNYKTTEFLRNGLFSLVECKLETGRTHQIRVHLSHIGHSIVGDQTYGNNKRKISSSPEVLQDKLLSFNHQALHSFYISFTHPRSGEILEFEKEPPVDYNELILFLRNN
jgi:23S rRNA pseudouridine1911/1915/1917 synthase